MKKQDAKTILKIKWHEDKHEINSMKTQHIKTILNVKWFEDKLIVFELIFEHDLDSSWWFWDNFCYWLMMQNDNFWRKKICWHYLMLAIFLFLHFSVWQTNTNKKYFTDVSSYCNHMQKCTITWWLCLCLFNNCSDHTSMKIFVQIVFLAGD